MGDTFQSLAGSPQQGNGTPYLPTIPAPSGREMLFRALAAAVPPPGHWRVRNSPLGAIYGTLGRVGAAYSGELADEMMRQRNDPLARQMQVYDWINQSGVQPYQAQKTVMSAPQMSDLNATLMKMNPDQPAMEPGAVVQRNPVGPTPMEMFAMTHFPGIFPTPKDQQAMAVQQAAIEASNARAEQARAQTGLIANRPTTEQAIRNLPLNLPPGFTAEIETKEGKISTTPQAQAKKTNDEAYAKLINDVAAIQKNNPNVTRPQAVEMALGQDPTLNKVPASQEYPLIGESKEWRQQVWANAQADRRERERLAQEGRLEARRNALLEKQLDVTVVPGVFADKSTGEIRQVMKGELGQNPSNFRRVSTQEATTADLLRTAMPLLDRMEELIPKVLAAHPSEQLPTILQNYVAGKYGANPDLQELRQIGASVSVEMARALSGSSRVLGTIFQTVRGETIPGEKVTAPVALRMISTGRQEIQNRLRSIAGLPQQKIEHKEPPTPPGAPGQPSQAEVDAAKKRLGIK